MGARLNLLLAESFELRQIREDCLNYTIIIMFYSKFIQLANPKLAIYLDLRIKNFKELITSGFLEQELRLRNSQKMRRLFCEVMCVLCEAKRRHCYADVKVKKEDFDLTHMTERFKAPNVDFANSIFLKDDPKELFIAVNELAYNISVKNVMNSCYWIEWIMDFEIICKSKKEKIKCERRSQIPVENKNQMDIIWLVWDLFLKESEKQSNIVQKLTKALLNLFTLKYTSGCQKKRKYILYFVISILCEKLNFAFPK